MRSVNIPLLTRKELLAKYKYNPETGALTRKYRMGRYDSQGLVGKLDAAGNRILRLKMQHGSYGMIALGRLIWFLVTGTLPPHYVRFKDGDKTNFRADNLKLGRRINTEENIAKYEAEQAALKAAQ